MAEGSKRTWIIVAAASVALLSCCCLGGGVAYFLSVRGDASSPFSETPTIPAGWVEHVQTLDCTPYNPMLSLRGFRIHHPPTQTIELCSQQQPSAYNYVTFYDSDMAGNMTGQFGLGYQFGPIDPTLIDQLIENLRVQMPIGSTFTLLDASGYAARGTTLTRKDYSLVTTAQMGLLAPGAYAFRVVLVPNEVNAAAGGLTLIIIKRADTGDTATALAGMETDYRAMIESIRY